jgi:uncharacterized protein with FMN-binding domain
MISTTLRRRALPLTFAAAAAGGVLASSPALAATSTKATYKGPAVDERWGTVQISVVVKSKKITGVKAAVSVHTGRSQFITDQALPVLKQEVLQAQSANIDTVSGATDLSDACDLSTGGYHQGAEGEGAVATFGVPLSRKQYDRLVSM